jgi:hypothetical protein
MVGADCSRPKRLPRIVLLEEMSIDDNQAHPLTPYGVLGMFSSKYRDGHEARLNQAKGRVQGQTS